MLRQIAEQDLIEERNSDKLKKLNRQTKQEDRARDAHWGGGVKGKAIDTYVLK